MTKVAYGQAAKSWIDNAYNTLENKVVAPAYQSWRSATDANDARIQKWRNNSATAGEALGNKLGAIPRAIGGAVSGGIAGSGEGLGGAVGGAIDGAEKSLMQTGMRGIRQEGDLALGVRSAPTIHEGAAAPTPTAPAAPAPPKPVGPPAPAPAKPQLGVIPGMPAAGTPVTPGMPTDERMHAQNKLNASAGGTVPAQKAPSAVGPTAAQLAQFRSGTASKFDPKSALDRAKMDALISGNKGWAANQGARGAMASNRLAGGAAMQAGVNGRVGHIIPPAPPRAQIVKSGSAFVMLEKGAASKATALAGAAQKGLGWIGKKLTNSGFDAGRAAVKAHKGAPFRLSATASERAESLAKAHSTGTSRINGGQSLINAGKSIGDSKGIQNAINYGGGTALAGAGLIGANRLGHSSGRKEGVSEGFDGGVQAGIEGAQANMEPGGMFGFGRGSINTGNAYGGIATDRDRLIQAILQRAGA